MIDRIQVWICRRIRHKFTPLQRSLCFQHGIGLAQVGIVGWGQKVGDQYMHNTGPAVGRRWVGRAAACPHMRDTLKQCLQLAGRDTVLILILDCIGDRV